VAEPVHFDTITPEQFFTVLADECPDVELPFRCPVCRCPHWLIGSVRPVYVEHDTISGKPRQYFQMYFRLICERCAHTLFFDAERLGFPPD
jgi:hypothetical protein